MEKITLPSPLKFWNCTKLMLEYVSKGFISSSSADFCTENHNEDDHGGIVMSSVCLGLARSFYKVVFGATLAKWTGEEENPGINTPSGNAETHDWSGHFSSLTKLWNRKERKPHATDLLRGVNSAKWKLNYDEKREEDDDVLWKWTTQSVMVSFLCFQFVYVFGSHL